MQIFNQQHKVIKGLDPVANAFAGTVRSDVVHMGLADEVTFIVYIGVGATGTHTFTVNACDDTTPSNRTAVPFYYQEVLSGDTPATGLTLATTAGFTDTAGSSRMAIITVKAEQCASSGYGWVELTSVEVVASACLGGIVAIASGVRNAENQIQTFIA